LYLKSSAGIKFPLPSSALPFPFQADTHGLTFFEYSYVGSVNQLNLTSLPTYRNESQLVRLLSASSGSKAPEDKGETDEESGVGVGEEDRELGWGRWGTGASPPSQGVDNVLDPCDKQGSESVCEPRRERLGV